MTYVQGFVVAVPVANKAAYVEMARGAWDMFKGYGALSTMEAWGDDLRDGKRTDFKRAVRATADETVVFSWIVWPDRDTCLAAQKHMEADMAGPMPDMPFDMGRMIHGGFEPIFEAGA